MRTRSDLSWFWCVVGGVLLLAHGGSAAPAAGAIPTSATPSSGTNNSSPDIESALHGFPVMFDMQGRKLANAEFTQKSDGDLLKVVIEYDFGSGHRVEEKASFRQQPELAQNDWSWSEFKAETRVRHFVVDFNSGRATAEKQEGTRTKHWSENLKIDPGRTFAGFGFILVLKTSRDRLVAGNQIEIKAVGFTPKPRIVPVQISFAGRDQIQMAGRSLAGDRFMIHPKVPGIVKAFVEVKETRIWLTPSHPVTFLRWEGPPVESDDPLIRVDLLPAEHSGPAEPAGR